MLGLGASSSQKKIGSKVHHWISATEKKSDYPNNPVVSFLAILILDHLLTYYVLKLLDSIGEKKITLFIAMAKKV